MISVADMRNQRASVMSRTNSTTLVKTDGDPEMRLRTSYWLELTSDTTDLGERMFCSSAVAAAKRTCGTAEDSYHRAAACHTS